MYYEIEKNFKPEITLWDKLAGDMTSGDSVLVKDKIEANTLVVALNKASFTQTIIKKDTNGYRVWGFLDVDKL
jgi:hypothetical protein|tara:strand:- start:543 stop:761 length:219 start_codon:yes stop_codon:yes gene_type:complete